MRSVVSRFLILLLVAAVSAGGALWYTQNQKPPAANPSEDGQDIPPRAVNLPRMELQAQYSGPLLHTLIQRWRDPIDGTICYIYLPIEAHHTRPTATGYVEYNSGSIGSMSCQPGMSPRPKPVAPAIP